MDESIAISGPVNKFLSVDSRASGFLELVAVLVAMSLLSDSKVSALLAPSGWLL